MAKNVGSSTILSAANLGAQHHHDMEIGDRIRQERRAAGITQETLADRVGVDKSAVGQWESSNSRTGITAPNLIKVAEVLAVPIGRLTGEDQDSKVELRAADEIELVLLFRQMEPKLKDVHLQLFRTAVGISKDRKAKGNPAKGRRVAPERPTKKSA